MNLVIFNVKNRRTRIYLKEYLANVEEFKNLHFEAERGISQ